MTSHTTPRTHSRVRGVAALATLLTILVGLPVLLLTVAGTPRLPSIDALARIGSILTSRDDGTLLFAVLTWIAWVAWAVFGVNVITELFWQARGRRAPRLRLPGQRTASGLVTAVLLLLGGAPALAAPMSAEAAISSRPVVTAQELDLHRTTLTTATVAAPAAPSGAVQAQEPSAPEETSSAHRDSKASSAGARYIVKHGDTLWGISERVLGEGRLFPSIAKLNYGAAQPDGGRLTDSHWVQPGWVLQLPPDAKWQDDAPPKTTHVVEPGETLSSIAAEELGDASQWREIAKATEDVRQPGGARLTDPDHIRPGWKVVLPQVADGSVKSGPSVAEPAESAAEPAAEPGAQPQQPAPAPPTPQGEDATAEETASTAVPSASSSITISPAPQSTSQQSAPTVPSAPGTETITEAADEKDLDAPAPVMVTGGIGVVLAGALLTLLAAKRRRQQHRRLPGQRIALPEPPSASVEEDLRGIEDPIRIEIVDHALRQLTRSLRDAGLGLPVIAAARLTQTHLELTLAAPAELTPPWTASNDHLDVWAISVHDVTSDPVDQAASYPCLVTVGVDHHDAHILLDLEHIGSLAVTGAEATAMSVLRAMALELALSPSADDLQVTLVGFGDELPAALGTGRLRSTRDVEPLIAELERRAAAAVDLLERSGYSDVQTARARADTPDAWTPEVLILGTQLDDETQERLAAVVRHLPRVGIAAVTTNRTDLGGWHLHLRRDSEMALLTHLGVQLRPQRVDDDAYRAILDLYDTADSEQTAPAPTWAPSVQVSEISVASLPTPTSLPQQSGGPTIGAFSEVDAPSDPTPDDAEPDDPCQNNQSTDPAPATIHRLAPRIRLLGPVEIEGAGELSESSKRGQLTEIAAWINLHPGADHHQLNEAIWPGNRATANTRNTAMSKLRRWLGQSDDGTSYLPPVTTGGYRLHPAVRSDWDLWQQLVAEPSTENLQEALGLVRGQPISGINPRRYAWAEFVRQEMISSVVDVAHEVALRALQKGDSATARRAAAAGRLADPLDERLWRDTFKAEYLAGNRSGLEDLADKLTDLLDHAGSDMETETMELLTELLHGRPGTSRAHA